MKKQLATSPNTQGLSGFASKTVFVALLLATMHNATAATYYVDPNGSDSNDGLSTTSPWQSCAKAGSTAIAGDIVRFRGGSYQTYNCNLNNSGTANNRIIFEAFPGELPILEASHMTPSYSNRWSMWSIVNINGNFVTFRGFEVKDGPSTGIRVNGDDAIVADNTVHHTFLTGITLALSYRATVDNNHVYDAYDYASGPPPGTGGGGDADCINNGFHLGPTADYVITNNIVHDCSDDGIDLWSSRGNTITGNISYHNGYIPFTNVPAGNGGGFKLGGRDASRGIIGGGNVVRFNVAANNRNHGFNNNSGTDNVIENNTAFNNSNNFAWFPTNSTVRNNLCWSGNCGYSNGSNNSWNLNIGDPLFVSTDPTSSGFLRLSPSSPAIDVGANIGLSFVGSAADLGAFENGAENEPDTKVPASPTNFAAADE